MAQASWSEELREHERIIRDRKRFILGALKCGTIVNSEGMQDIYRRCADALLPEEVQEGDYEKHVFYYALEELVHEGRVRQTGEPMAGYFSARRIH